MNKFILSLALAFFMSGYAFAFPIFKGLNNYNGKTTIKIEIPASDRDASNGLSKTFEDCTLSFTINGEAVCMDIQDILMSSIPQTILLPKTNVLQTP